MVDSVEEGFEHAAKAVTLVERLTNLFLKVGKLLCISKKK